MPTIAQDIARLLAIAGTDRIPVSQKPPPPTESENIDIKHTRDTSVAVHLLPSAASSAAPIADPIELAFRLQTFFAAIVVSIVVAALLTLSSILLVPTDELFQYRPPLDGAQIGSLLKVDAEPKVTGLPSLSASHERVRPRDAPPFEGLLSPAVGQPANLRKRRGTHSEGADSMDDPAVQVPVKIGAG
eukprot:CAMPEP_0183350770 /NCGR_PEP_ID=MMETSP0164_2-20130417/20767_1 /TAXON_ID=221442 /ORGANISM="Coccolithus pelagicus ssp braarudi, Strain PLY182g" /LENGTH=187 /DNA_ID=CAMNT_0025522753 /DNA_START=110 /DNA_END=673 /DNA_ORIENTATION=+